MAFEVIPVVFFVIVLVSSAEIILSNKDYDVEVTIFGEIGSNFSANLAITVPGTKWCGPGDNAEDLDDLGKWKNVDVCCRAHDNCFDYMEAGETKHGLKNPDLFTRLHCKCEQEFRNCLKKAENLLSTAIGYTYTTARKYCYMHDYPIKKCIKYQEGYIQKRCIKYKLDKRKPKEWQWFDIPFF